MPNTPRKTAANDGSAETKVPTPRVSETSSSAGSQNSDKTAAPQRRKSTKTKQNRVKINSRVVFAPGGQGSHAMCSNKKESGFSSMLKKSKPAPAAPSIGVAKSHIYGETGLKKNKPPEAEGAGAERTLKEWVPDARNAPYAYWRVVKNAAGKQAKAKMLLDAVERVVGTVVHCVHSKPYVPPQVSGKTIRPCAI